MRASLLFWGAWMLVSGLVFSYLHGITHPYYTAAIAPALAAVTAISTRELWRRKAVRILAGNAGPDAGGDRRMRLRSARPNTGLAAARWTMLLGAIVVAVDAADQAELAGRGAAVLCAAGLLLGLGGSASPTIHAVNAGHQDPQNQLGRQQQGARGFTGWDR